MFFVWYFEGVIILKNYALRVNEKNYEIARTIIDEKGISFNEYINQLLERDLTDDLWVNVEERVNRKIDLLSKVMEEQTKEYINTKTLLMATIDVLLESLNVEVESYDEEKD